MDLFTKKIEKKVYYIILFLFVFLTFNREFMPFGIDFRFLILPIISFLTIVKIVFGKFKFNRMQYLISFFFGYLFIITMFSYFRHDFIDRNIQLNTLLLFLYNYILIIFFTVYNEYFETKIMEKYIIISFLVLIISMFLPLAINILPFSNQTGIVSNPRTFNFYGYSLRLAGYAQDPNYASLSIVITIFFLLASNTDKKMKAMITFLGIISFGFSASKTVAIGAFFSLLLYFADLKLLKNITVNKIVLRRFIYNFLAILIVVTPIILVWFNLTEYLFGNLSTMSQRYHMWKSSIELFQANIFGSGITAARSYFSLVSRNVQVHSTIFQLLADGGVLSILLYILLFSKILTSTNVIAFTVGIVFMLFSLTYETLHLSFFALVVIIYYFYEYQKFSDKKIDLVFINSLSGGGAEKIGKLLVEEMSKYNRLFAFTQSTGASDYFINRKNVKVSDASIKYLITSIYKVNSVIDFYGENQINTSSTHLFKSHVLTSFSRLSFKSLYVMHGTPVSYKLGSFNIFYRLIYYKKKIIFVNQGIDKSFQKSIGFKPKRTLFIKNFLDFESILVKSKSALELENIERKYIIFVGRLDSVKDPLLALEVFRELRKHYDYDLYILGEGVLKESLVKYVEANKLEKYVYFKGFVDNPYPYIKNAELLLVTSLAESDSLVMLESLYLKTKVISVDCDFGPRNILKNNLKDFLVKTRDPKKIVEVVTDAIENYPSEYDFVFENRTVGLYKMKLEEYYNEK